MDFSSSYFLMSLLSGFFSVAMVLFLLIFMIIPCIFLYFVAEKPNKVISGLFSIKIWGAIFFMILFPIGVLLNNLLKAVGFSEYGYWSMDKDLLRVSLVSLALGVLLYFGYKKFFAKTVLNDGKDKKTPALFMSQLFHVSLISLFTVLCLFIVGDTLNYLLQFLLSNYGGGSLLSFISDLLSLAIPVVLLWFIVRPSIFSGKRFLLELKSDALVIFFNFVILGALLTFLLLTGLFANQLLDFLFGLGWGFNTEKARVLIVGIALSSSVFLFFASKAGGKKMFLK